MKRTTVVMIDDIDGTDGDETITFEIDGGRYEVDLSTKNATRLRNALAPYMEAGERVGRTHRTVSRTAIPRQQSAGTAHRGVARGSVMAQLTAARERNQAIRAWAKEHGFAIADKGSIKREIVAAWEQATKGGTTNASLESATNGSANGKANGSSAAPVPPAQFSGAEPKTQPNGVLKNVEQPVTATRGARAAAVAAARPTRKRVHRS